MTALVRNYFRDLATAAGDGWNRFWFAPADPATLSMIRILAGAMLFYTHLVWSLRLEAFFGPDSWTNATIARMGMGERQWSYLWWIDSPGLLWATHIGALVVLALLTLGLFSRVMSVLAFVIAVSYVHRAPGALFGLDQINCMLAMYLMIGPCGDAFSLDRWLAARRAGHGLPPAAPSVTANIAVRLIQLHMCVIYFFAGLSKMQGVSWWLGTALWGAFGNYEYQSLDMLWMAHWPLLIAVMTQVTVYWELMFPAIIWPRLMRPITLALAIPLHLGIGICLGMMTFGLAMLIGCSSFIPPWLVRRVFDRRESAESANLGASRPLVIKDNRVKSKARRSPA